MAKEKFERIALVGSAAWLFANPIGPRICLAPDGGAAGGGEGGGGGSGGGGGDPPGGGGGQGDGGGTFTFAPPADLPAHLIGKDPNETVSKIWNMANGYRQRDAEREQTFGKVPKTPREYGFQPTDKLKPYLNGFENDGFLNTMFDKAHARGLTDKQANGFFTDIMEHMVEGGLVDDPIDYEAELAELVPAEAANLDDKGKKDAITKRIKDNLAWLDNVKAQDPANKQLGEIMDFFSQALGDRRVGQLGIEFIRGLMGGGNGPALGGAGGGGSLTEAQLDARFADPRNQVGGAKYDKEFAKETERLTQVFENSKRRA